MSDKSELRAITLGLGSRPLTTTSQLKEAKWNVSQSAQFGDVVFEGLRFGEKGISFLKTHLARLRDGATFLGLRCPSDNQLARLLASTVSASGLSHGYIRLLVGRPWDGWGISMTTDQPHCICGVGTLELHKRKKKHNGLRVMITSTRKAPHDVLNGHVKWGGNYCNAKLAHREATRNGLDDGIMLTPGLIVSEATVANLFWSRSGDLYTPSITEKVNCLPGITRATVISAAQDLGIHVIQDAFPGSELRNVDEAFISGTGAGLAHIGEIDKRAVGGGVEGPITRALKRAYASAALKAALNVQQLLLPLEDE